MLRAEHFFPQREHLPILDFGLLRLPLIRRRDLQTVARCQPVRMSRARARALSTLPAMCIRSRSTDPDHKEPMRTAPAPTPADRGSDRCVSRYLAAALRRLRIRAVPLITF